MRPSVFGPLTPSRLMSLVCLHKMEGLLCWSTPRQVRWRSWLATWTRSSTWWRPLSRWLSMLGHGWDWPAPLWTKSPSSGPTHLLSLCSWQVVPSSRRATTRAMLWWWTSSLRRAPPWTFPHRFIASDYEDLLKVYVCAVPTRNALIFVVIYLNFCYNTPQFLL